jgi:cytochrome b6-f complex iron-sulfur subunit/menaquinol-cytochrome c reductase iron-sulfur subunit
MAERKEDQRAATSPPANEPAPEERRSALKMLVTVGGLAYAGALAVPAGQFLMANGESAPAGGRWIKVGRLADLTPGTPKRLRVVADQRDAFTVTKNEELGSVWLLRDGDKVHALSATCPHLGCSIDLNADHKSFGCPCHTSRFKTDGSFESGPSPRAMDALETRVVGDAVEVNFRRFRQGITEKEEVA